LNSSARNIVEVKIAVHAMFMASGDPVKFAISRVETTQSRALTPHLHGMSPYLSMAHVDRASAAVTHRSIARLHAYSGEMTC
jgi:hypothetical protein